ncbi:MurR/RpiR family transcriptional regulator [Roseomonas sp. E05]|uniref:MurR/RpiR family transcriptional regulator n=1 Tax=Roseomonas sp. E05 TaxID=3046310 RepID=UPI0024BB2CCE|nr:MurR/RpiR family transcriptional regulator [Roseomonas sp. E05]MDJ0386671.1 MurR/RpiR family transcriptional regulator [Roseomonas sp. E05]
MSIPPDSFPALALRLQERLPGLSPQFQRIARYLLANPDEVALAPLRVLAGHVAAHPSALVRFAKSFGYDGFREMQRLFKSAVFARAQGVTAEASRLHRRLAPHAGGLEAARAVVAHEMAGLRSLLDGLDEAALQAAGRQLGRARLVWIGCDAEGRPAAAALHLLLARHGRPASLLDGAPDLARAQLGTARAEDALLLIGLGPAAARQGEALPGQARALGCPVLLLGAWGGLAPEGVLRFALPPPAGGQPPALAPALAWVQILGACLAAEAGQGAALGEPRFADFDPLGW